MWIKFSIKVSSIYAKLDLGEYNPVFSWLAKLLHLSEHQNRVGS